MAKFKSLADLGQAFEFDAASSRQAPNMPVAWKEAEKPVTKPVRAKWSKTSPNPIKFEDYGFAKDLLAPLIAGYHNQGMTKVSEVALRLKNDPRYSRYYGGLAQFAPQFFNGNIAIIDVKATKKAGKGIDQPVYTAHAMAFAAVANSNAKDAYRFYVAANKDYLESQLSGASRSPSRGRSFAQGGPGGTR